MTPLGHVWDNGLNGNCEILTSTYAYLEVIHGKAGYGQAYPDEESDKRIHWAFEQPHVIRVQLDVEAGKMARSLKRQHHPTLGKRSDAIHLASALCYNVDALHTWDNSDLLPFNDKLKCKNGRLLPIVKPGADVMGLLFGMVEDESKKET